MAERLKNESTAAADGSAGGPVHASAKFELPYLREFLVLLAGWILFFQLLGNSTLGYVDTRSLFGWWLWTMKGIEDQQHAFLIPFGVAALMYVRRDELALVPKRLWWPGLGLVALALVLHVAGYLVQQARISVIAFVLGIYGMTGLFWGRAWLRATFLLFVLLLFCVPMGTGMEPLTFPLRLVATRITAIFCQSVLGVDVIHQGNQLLDAGGNYQYEVAAACSGLRSLTAILAFSVIYAYLNLKSFWRSALLLLSGLPFAVLANVVRLVAIVAAAEAFGQGAGNFVHENPVCSLLPYVPALAGLMLVGHWLRPRSRPPEGTSDLPSVGRVRSAQEARPA